MVVCLLDAYPGDPYHMQHLPRSTKEGGLVECLRQRDVRCAEQALAHMLVLGLSNLNRP